MKQIIVGMGTCGLSAGAQAVMDTLRGLHAAHTETATLSGTGCIGMCYREPLVEIREDDVRTLYGGVSPDVAAAIFQAHVLEGRILESAMILRVDANGFTGIEAPFLEGQDRVVLRNCGIIDPESIDACEARGGYLALRKALFEMNPATIVQEVKDSGLRGRGGAGFPTGLKWSFVAAQPPGEKFVVCNADEGDPGAFMDRSVLEGDPHAVLEGMIICARAIGASRGFVYCRAEYPLAIRRLHLAIDAARQRGYLGPDILGSGLGFDILIKQGAGAFVCGEETALFASIEGQRGMPRLRPPFPAEKGLWQRPTNNNNVETYANIPAIIRDGAVAWAAPGSGRSRGTKVFSLAGRVRRGGLAEVPMGMSIHDLVMGIGGGIKQGREPKAVQMGGPSGGCIPVAMWDTPVDFEAIPKTGAIMGSGGMVVMDDTTCMVDMARFFLHFTQDESCGKCTFCRIGTLRMLEILERLTRGEGKQEDLAHLEELALQVKQSSLCGLGQSAPNPVLTTLRYYADEYKAHIEGCCPARSCLALVNFTIDPERCTSCSLCAKACSVGAISGRKGTPYVIDHATCVRCGRCITSCAFGAVQKV